MKDLTEMPRRLLVAKVNSEVETDDEAAERKRLEAKWGQVWSTDEMCEDFNVEGFMAPFVVVKRKSDGVRGSLSFQARPRFYFSFTAERR